MFADADLKFDQPQAEVVFDRDKVRSQGVDLRRGRPRPRDHARRRLRQPLQHPGAQLQGHPADQAQRAADPRPALRHLHHRAERQAGAAVDLRHARDLDAAARAQALPAAQRGAHPGGDPAGDVSLDAGAEVPRGRGGEDPAAPASRSTTPASRGSCARKGASSSPPSCSRRSSSTWCSRRSSRASATRSSSSPGSVPLAIAGALVFSFLGLTTLNIYSQVGSDHAGRPGVEERHPDRASSPTTCRRRDGRSSRR